MLNCPLLAIGLAPNAPWSAVLLFMLMGFVLVLIVLGLLAVIIALQYKILALLSPSSAPRAASGASPDVLSVAPASAATDAIDPRIIAVLAAAVDSVISEPHQILSIRPAPANQNWSVEGRRQIFASHHVR